MAEASTACHKPVGRLVYKRWSIVADELPRLAWNAAALALGAKYATAEAGLVAKGGTNASRPAADGGKRHKICKQIDVVH